MLENLQKVVLVTGAKIVLSSCWKNHFCKTNGKIVSRTDKGYKLLNLFAKYDLSIYDLTPFKDASKETEIMMWLNRNNPDSFIIMDDEASCFEELSSYVIRTNNSGSFDLGLTYEKANQSIKLLNENVFKRVK